MTDVVVTIEQRYDRTPDGRIWTPMFDYIFWKRYLDVFENVRVLARVRDVPEVPSDRLRADGDRVSFIPVPHYIGPIEYLRRLIAVNRVVRTSLKPRDAVILRVDSQIAACLHPILRRSRRPYGVEVVVDPYDVFAPGAIKHPLRAFFRWKFTYQMKRQCAEACAASYVTSEALQRRYPPRDDAFKTHYSSVELPDAAYAVHARVQPGAKLVYNLVTTAYLVDSRKGVDVLIDAMASCKLKGLVLVLSVIGDGKLRPILKAQAERLGLADRVHFLGQLTTDKVREQLDQADLFVLASRGEGLPRALIEAMARGLPGIGTEVGGFPELLSDDYLVPPGQAEALAKKLIEVLSDYRHLNVMAEDNLKKAKDYHKDVLSERRSAFFKFLKNRTEKWNLT